MPLEDFSDGSHMASSQSSSSQARWMREVEMFSKVDELATDINTSSSILGRRMMRSGCNFPLIVHFKASPWRMLNRLPFAKSGCHLLLSFQGEDLSFGAVRRYTF